MGFVKKDGTKQYRTKKYRGPVKLKLMILICLAMTLLLVALFAHKIVPYDPYAQNLSNALQAPGKEHIFGTDRYGRDILSRVIMGSRATIFSSLLLLGMISIFGTLVGVICGYIGGKFDSFVMRISDIFLAFPGMVFAIAVAGVLGGGIMNAVIALAVISWPKYARLARGQVLTIKNMPYVQAAILSNSSFGKIIFKQILPNIFAPILITATLDLGTMIMELAGLSFLGLGAMPPMAEWGSMMSNGRSMIQTSPWVIFAPGFAIFVSVTIFNLLGDTIRDVLDPKNHNGTSDISFHSATKGKSSLIFKYMKERVNKMKIIRRIMLLLLITIVTVTLFTGCGQSSNNGEVSEKPQKIVFNYGTTAYGPEMGNSGLNPHSDYSGWSSVRYGVGETLFKFNESMQIEPWLATDYEQIDEYTVKINLRDDVNFSSGRKMDGQAVKECLDNLIAVHDRAPGDLKIKEITADGQSITIVSEEKVPALLNYLSDPYGAIIDMEYGVTEDRNVAGTGPYIAEKVSDTEINLVKNEKYWGGEVKVDRVNVKAITDGDTLTMALQSGEIDATQGLPYASYSLFEDNNDYKISSTNTSRAFFAQLNFATPALQDINVRKAIAMGIDKEGFTEVLLNGKGSPAVGVFPSNFKFGNEAVKGPTYDVDAAKQLLEEARWKDTNNDGFVDKGGKNLTIRWLTYPGRQELPLLAESVQATLKEIGIDVKVNSTENHRDFLESGNWDIYASAFVTAPTGDPEYFFTTHSLKSSAKNRGGYYNEELEKQAGELRNEFNKDKRSDLAVQMQQIILDDVSFIFASHLQMSFVMKSNITGFEAHPSDYYEITANLEIQ
ncbi:nickel transporter permease [Alkalibaculum bacchi]|uniref:nickel transporter permease n=1 Tax=Alkalibaculum bacchi TaxID=645887 RepID=UPI00350E363A